MFFNSPAEVFGENLKRHLLSLAALALMAAVYYYLPGWIESMHTWVYGPTPAHKATIVERAITTWWPYIYYTAPIIIVLVYEIAGFAFVRKRADPVRYAREYALLAEVTKQAGLWFTPKLVVLEQKKKSMNAAATRSILFGRKVILQGEILNLPDDQLRAIIAHEVAHLKNRDVLLLAPMSTLRLTLGLHKTIVRVFGIPVTLCIWILMNKSFWYAAAWGLLLAILVGLFLAWKNHRGNIAQNGFVIIAAGGALVGIAFALYNKQAWYDLMFTTLAGTLVIVAGMVVERLAKYHSRLREYLADAGAASYLGWESRHSLAHGLLSVYAWYKRQDPEKLAKAQKKPWLLTHPTMDKRLAALRV